LVEFQHGEVSLLTDAPLDKVIKYFHRR
jgi:hypothetical protein